ncbi:hypothetical protein MY04_5507 [Flammeovirga sp. MY04]|uniref:hypothetical protein n=1 Tax=Flammeovirga sp. MY04 TaxID=1191459 RepID=UPI00080626E9|nr:hypothetical protein [Flammeovirga sp. MY04]ANQ52838.1 hypothetical protein MY04_5507 [Flammeovirga sp. MY04]
MQKLIVISILLLILGCNSRESKNNNSSKKGTTTQETPEVFQEKNIIEQYKARARGRGNLFYQLYSEALEKDKNLRKIENDYLLMREAQENNLKKYNKFNNSNNYYYAEAHDFIHTILDSTIRMEVMQLVEESKKKYSHSVSEQEKIKNSVIKNSNTIEDLHKVLQVVVTLKMIENYQNNEMESGQSIENIIQDQENFIKELKKNIK